MKYLLAEPAPSDDQPGPVCGPLRGRGRSLSVPVRNILCKTDFLQIIVQRGPGGGRCQAKLLPWLQMCLLRKLLLVYLRQVDKQICLRLSDGNCFSDIELEKEVESELDISML